MFNFIFAFINLLTEKIFVDAYDCFIRAWVRARDIGFVYLSAFFSQARSRHESTGTDVQKRSCACAVVKKSNIPKHLSTMWSYITFVRDETQAYRLK